LLLSSRVGAWLAEVWPALPVPPCTLLLQQYHHG
jgi:hypothetical protein